MNFNVLGDTALGELKKELPTLHCIDEEFQEGLYDFVFKGKTIQVTGAHAEALNKVELVNLLRPFVIGNGKTACNAVEKVDVICHMHVPDELPFNCIEGSPEAQEILSERNVARTHMNRALSIAEQHSSEQSVDYAPISVKRAVALYEQLTKLIDDESYVDTLQIVELDEKDYSTTYRFNGETKTIEVVLGSKSMSELVEPEALRQIEAELKLAQNAMGRPENKAWGDGYHMGNVRAWNVVKFQADELDRYLKVDGPEPMTP